MKTLSCRSAYFRQCRSYPKQNRQSKRRLDRNGAGIRQAISSEIHDLELDDFENYLLELQLKIVEGAEDLERPECFFCEDRWDRQEGTGFGVTRVLEHGSTLEKAAVNVSIIRGVLNPERAKAMSTRGRGIDPSGGQKYSAAALSLVFHPLHPFVSTLRADVRRFSVDGMSWYGGGADLTPSYLFPEDARDFHLQWKRICDARSPELYPKLKAWCDEYFYIPARLEHRGIGGIFFDDLDPDSESYDVVEFVKEVGNQFLPSWTPIVQRRTSLPYGEEERQWQLLRRGRYIEFNLLYDRGIQFGLKGGRMESIMVSAPPLVAWNYNIQPSPGSREHTLLSVLKSPVDWASYP